MIKLILFVLLISACTHTSPTRKVGLIDGKSRKNYEAYGKNIMISTQGEETTRASKKIYEQGGNLVDVALAASFAISVERPHSSGLGGGGFWLDYKAKTGSSRAYDFREMAPIKSHSKIFLNAKGEPIEDKSLTGGTAVGVPGLVAGLLKIHKEQGKLPLDVIMAPAIEMAEKGIVVYPALFEAMTEERERLAKFKSTAKIFLDENLRPWPVGHRLIQKDLAQSLRLIAKYGESVFYHGELAKKIVASVKSNGGILDLKDMREYKVIERKPIEGRAYGAKIISMPPPSSGGVHIIEILKVLENYPLKAWGPQSAQTVHTVSSAMQLAFVDRARYMGDSDFVNVPLNEIISDAHIKKLKNTIQTNRANKSHELEGKNIIQIKESDHTIHFSFMDGEGNAIVSTQTINGWFGSALVAEGTGIVLNNEMDDFATHVGGSNLFGAIGGKNNLVEARKRPLSSMSPTVVIDDKNNRMLALGTPSGTRILTCVMQTILNYLEFDKDLWDAVAMARYHHQWKPDQLVIETPFFDKATEDKLMAMGHKIKHEDLYCSIEAIEWKRGQLHGVSDPREEGMSWGM